MDSLLDQAIADATATGGVDSVQSVLASYTLQGNVENLTFTGNSLTAVSLTGNGSANALTGLSAGKTLPGSWVTTA